MADNYILTRQKDKERIVHIEFAAPEIRNHRNGAMTTLHTFTEEEKAKFRYFLVICNLRAGASMENRLYTDGSTPHLIYSSYQDSGLHIYVRVDFNSDKLIWGFTDSGFDSHNWFTIMSFDIYGVY